MSEIDDDEVAADWEASLAAEEDQAEADAEAAALAEQAEGPIDDEAVAVEWEAMVDADGDGEGGMVDVGGQTAATSPSRVLNQDEIDTLLGFTGDDEEGERTGIRAIVNSTLVSYERLASAAL